MSEQPIDEAEPVDSTATAFGVLVEKLLSRRDFLQHTTAIGIAAWVANAGLPRSALAGGGDPDWLCFDAVATNSRDTITIPRGFRWHVVASWGDPLWRKGIAFDPHTCGTGASQELAFGDNNDGMGLFNLSGHTVIAVNNEDINKNVFYCNRQDLKPANADDIHKAKSAHGVTIMEIEQHNGIWSIVQDSPYNRRITADTPIAITGPAQGHDLLKTAADPGAIRTLGTWSNCGSGRTPWNTYLSCEENFNDYFSSSDPAFELTPAFQRYGIGLSDKGYAWADADERFDIHKHPNEPNRVGYVVEIDPSDPESVPKKRTALGRLKHENVAVVVAESNHVVAYMGDDERGEYLYRFVSNDRYRPHQNNSDLLDNGSLYVARFDLDGGGQWLELNSETTAMRSEAEICVHTRLAASRVAATTMDRPEWIAANPRQPEVYCCLTNNKHRGKKPNRGGDPTPVGGPNPRKNNRYGQIVRWIPDHGDHTAIGFRWDLFVVAGNPLIHRDEQAGSSNVTADNMFNSPDGLAFDDQGGLWIQTDGKYSNQGRFAGHGNNQMLFANPNSREIKRFLVGPKECEITGLCWSPDRKTMFVGIQHPGEKGNSHFPDGSGTLPRSSIIAITRNDGGNMG